MKKVFIFIVMILMVGLGEDSFSAVKDEGVSPEQKAKILSQMKGLNISFIANEGQVEKEVKFYAKTFGGTVFVTNIRRDCLFIALIRKERS